MKTIPDFPVIDAHGHLGDILNPQGGELIFETGIRFPVSLREWFLCERVLYRETVLYKAAQRLSPLWSVKSEQKRNRAATLENLSRSLLGTNIIKCVCAPVSPFVSYDDLRRASRTEPRIIAFCSPDFTLGVASMCEKLKNDLQNGAAGVKIHPIIQNTAADGEFVKAAVETLSPYKVPVLIHTGPATYYLPCDGVKTEAVNASVRRAARLAGMFPDVRFIAGHAGLDDYAECIRYMAAQKNVYVDTSFQHPRALKDLIGAFGGSRVLFASDWHYGRRGPALKAADMACGDDDGLRRAIFYENAAFLLGI